MLKPKFVAVSVLAALAASATFAADGGHDEGKHMKPPMREQMRGEMKAFREAVMSGALTDTELATLKKEREDAMKQMRQIHERLQARTKELISNPDKGPKRDKWPEELIGKPHHVKGSTPFKPHRQDRDNSGMKDI